MTRCMLYSSQCSLSCRFICRFASWDARMAGHTSGLDLNSSFAQVMRLPQDCQAKLVISLFEMEAGFLTYSPLHFL